MAVAAPVPPVVGGTTHQVRELDGVVDYIMAYVAVTPVSDYTVQQYFLRNSIARASR